MEEKILMLKSLVDQESFDTDQIVGACKLVKNSLQSTENDEAVFLALLKILQGISSNGSLLNQINTADYFIQLIHVTVGALTRRCRTNYQEKTSLLLEQYLDFINVLSESSIEAKAVCIETFCQIYFDILILNKTSDFRHRLEVLRSLNILLEDSSCAVKENLLSKQSIIDSLRKLVLVLTEVGDYEFQVCIAECIFRIIPKKIREEMITKLFQDEALMTNFLKIRDNEFETDCRIFLNQLNFTLTGSNKVFSLPCLKAWLGDKELYKPDDPSYDIFWVDFNGGSKRLTVFCGSYNNSEASCEDLWETLTVWKEDIYSFNIKKVKKVKVVNILLSKMVSDIYPSQQDVSGRSVRLQFDIHCNVEDILGKTFGLEKSGPKVSSVSTPLPLPRNIDSQDLDNEDIPCTPVQTSHRRKVSVPDIPMSAVLSPACSISSKVSEPVTAVRINYLNGTNLEKKNSSKVFQTPKCKERKEKVKTPVVTVTPPTKSKKKTVEQTTPPTKAKETIEQTTLPTKSKKETVEQTENKKCSKSVEDIQSTKASKTPVTEAHTELSCIEVDSIPDSCQMNEPDVASSEKSEKEAIPSSANVERKENNETKDKIVEENKSITKEKKISKQKPKSSKCKTVSKEENRKTPNLSESKQDNVDDFEVLESFPKPRKSIKVQKERENTKNQDNEVERKETSCDKTFDIRKDHPDKSCSKEIGNEDQETINKDKKKSKDKKVSRKEKPTITKNKGKGRKAAKKPDSDIDPPTEEEEIESTAKSSIPKPTKETIIVPENQIDDFVQLSDDDGADAMLMSINEELYQEVQNNENEHEIIDHDNKKTPKQANQNDLSKKKNVEEIDVETTKAEINNLDDHQPNSMEEDVDEISKNEPEDEEIPLTQRTKINKEFETIDEYDLIVEEDDIYRAKNNFLKSRRNKEANKSNSVEDTHEGRIAKPTSKEEMVASTKEVDKKGNEVLNEKDTESKTVKQSKKKSESDKENNVPKENKKAEKKKRNQKNCNNSKNDLKEENVKETRLSRTNKTSQKKKSEDSGPNSSFKFGCKRLPKFSVFEDSGINLEDETVDLTVTNSGTVLSYKRKEESQPSQNEQGSQAIDINIESNNQPISDETFEQVKQVQKGKLKSKSKVEEKSENSSPMLEDKAAFINSKSVPKNLPDVITLDKDVGLDSDMEITVPCSINEETKEEKSIDKVHISKAKKADMSKIGKYSLRKRNKEKLKEAYKLSDTEGDISNAESIEESLASERLQSSQESIPENLQEVVKFQGKQYEGKADKSKPIMQSRKFFQSNTLSETKNRRQFTSTSIKKFNAASSFGFGSPTDNRKEKTCSTKRSVLLLMSYSQSDGLLPCEKGDAGTDPYDFDSECDINKKIYTQDKKEKTKAFHTPNPKSDNGKTGKRKDEGMRKAFEREHLSPDLKLFDDPVCYENKKKNKKGKKSKKTYDDDKIDLLNEDKCLNGGKHTDKIKDRKSKKYNCAAVEKAKKNKETNKSLINDVNSHKDIKKKVCSNDISSDSECMENNVEKIKSMEKPKRDIDISSDSDCIENNTDKRKPRKNQKIDKDMSSDSESDKNYSERNKSRKRKLKTKVPSVSFQKPSSKEQTDREDRLDFFQDVCDTPNTNLCDTSQVTDDIQIEEEADSGKRSDEWEMETEMINYEPTQEVVPQKKGSKKTQKTPKLYEVNEDIDENTSSDKDEQESNKTHSILNNFSKMCKRILNDNLEPEDVTSNVKKLKESNEKNRNKMIQTPRISSNRSCKTPVTPGNIRKLYKSLDISVIKTPKTPASLYSENGQLSLTGLLSQKTLEYESCTEDIELETYEKETRDEKKKKKKHKSPGRATENKVSYTPSTALNKILSRSLASVMDMEETEDEKEDLIDQEVEYVMPVNFNGRDKSNDMQLAAKKKSGLISGPSTSMRPSKSSLKRKYSSLNIEDLENSQEEDEEDKPYVPRKLFKEHRFMMEEQTYSNEISSSSAESCEIMPDINPSTEVSTLLKAFGVDVQRHLTEKRNHLDALTKTVLKSSQKQMNSLWIKQQQKRSLVLTKYQNNMTSELIALEKDMSTLKEAEEKTLIYFKDQMKQLQHVRHEQSKRLNNLCEMQQELQEELDEVEKQSSKEHVAVKSKLKENLASLQKKLLLESQREELNQVKRNLQTMFF